MAVSKKECKTPAEVPIYNINTHVRIPGEQPTPLSRVLQEWDTVNLSESKITEPGESYSRRAFWVHVTNSQGQFRLPVSEQLYEVGLYTRATKRFGDWMKENAGKSGTRAFGA